MFRKFDALGIFAMSTLCFFAGAFIVLISLSATNTPASSALGIVCLAIPVFFAVVSFGALLLWIERDKMQALNSWLRWH